MAKSYSFKIATEDWEIEQIHRLNYETFVEEIPQHQDQQNPEKMLVYKFHDENTYIICVNSSNVIGMLAIRARRPFSLDQKLKNLDDYLPPARSVCEIRLLSVKKQYRRTKIVYELVAAAAQYCTSHGHDLAIISGILQQQKLYRHMGFVPFGPVVGTREASFQPMYLTPAAFAKLKKEKDNPFAAVVTKKKISLLPGPVHIAPHVHKALGELPISHRSESFLKMHRETKRLLCRLVKAQHVEIFTGSGTLANDIVAGQLSLLRGKGLILSNGEFGDRLIQQARRFNLSFETVRLDWGDIFNYGGIKKTIDRTPDLAWLWAVHCETSTGVFNDTEALKQMCAENKILLCLDCISAIGTTQVDLHDVYLASGVSGKALGGFPGLSMVFYNHTLGPSGAKLPIYLDLSYYAEKNGVPFTTSSNLLYALYTALRNFNLERRLEQIADISQWLKAELRKMGLSLIIADHSTSPFVITISLPAKFDSRRVAEQMEEKGYLLSYNSEYLVKRNWFQICLMGDFSRDLLQPLLEHFQKILKQH